MLNRIAVVSVLGLFLAASEPAALGAEPKCPPGVPVGAEAWVVVPSPEASVERARKIVEAVVPGMGAMAEMQLRAVLAGTGGEAVDATKPLVAVFKLGKKRARAVAVKLKAEGDAVKTLEARYGKAAKTEDGIMTFLEVQEGALPDKEVYATVKLGRLVVGDGRELVKLLAATAAPEAGKLPKGVDILAGLDVETVAAAHKESIETFLKKLATDPTAALGMKFPGAPPGGGEVPAKKLDAFKMIGATYAGLIRSGLKEVRVLGLALRLGEGQVSLGGGLQAVEGGELAGALKKLAGAELPGAKALSGRNMAAVAAAISPEVMIQITELVEKVATPAVAAEGDEQLGKDVKEYFRLCKESIKHMDGKFVEALRHRGGGLSVVFIAGVKDPAAARASAVKMVRLTEKGSLAGKMGELGMKFSLKEKARESGGISVDRITVTYDPPVNPNVPEEMQARMQEMQKKMIRPSARRPPRRSTGWSSAPPGRISRAAGPWPRC